MAIAKEHAHGDERNGPQGEHGEDDLREILRFFLLNFSFFRDLYIDNHNRRTFM